MSILHKIISNDFRVCSQHLRTFVKKEVRLRNKSRTMNSNNQKPKYVPGTVSLQVLGSGAIGSPASVYLFTDQTRYLFNCGEGTQRLAHEHKTKLSKLQHIFFTDKSWSKLGGLPGLVLTLQDAGVTKLTLHGPPALKTLFQAMSRFIILKKMNIETVNILTNNIFEDEVMTVQAFEICSCNTTKHQDYAENRLPSTILYVCKLKPKPGILDLKKCVDMGVPPGPLLGLLKSGIDIVLADGTSVKSSEVREPTTENQTLIFVDIPDEGYIKSLLDQFDQFDASVVVHLAPNSVVCSPAYQLFTTKFSKLTSHLFLNSSNRFSGYTAAHRIQAQLNQVDGLIFPILGEAEQINYIYDSHKRIKITCNEDDEKAFDSTKTSCQIISNVQSLTSFRLRPYSGLDRSLEPKINFDEYIQEINNLEGFTDALQNFKSMIKERRLEEPSNQNIFPKIIFLGTGSCIPNKTRNVSGILIQPNEESFFLLDCGEGTLGQIIRFYGPARWQEVIQNLKAIFVSHLHADHHIGLIGVLKERSNLHMKLNPLHLFAPKQIEPWLLYYHDMIEPISDCYTLISNGDMINEPYQSTILESMGINTLLTCLVKHCPHSYGITISLASKDEFSRPFKITYSGDTMPSKDLINLGLNSTVLIHEATMEDELIEEAKMKMHCTVSQALNVAKEMNAKYTILTHFSQRYAKLPRLPEKLSKDVAFAFDFMQVTVDDLKTFSLMYPLMKIMFSEHYEEMERKTKNRMMKSGTKRKPAP